jgi:hypothetical protein
VVTGCTAIDLLAFLRHFFLWVRLPCPGPGMLTSGVVTRLGLREDTRQNTQYKAQRHVTRLKTQSGVTEVLLYDWHSEGVERRKLEFGMDSRRNN